MRESGHATVGEGAPDGGTARDERRWALVVSKSIGVSVEVVAAVLVAAEVFVLLAGVASRYLFSSPLIWTDEVASILFLWLAMLGAVVAMHRGEHMRMPALVSRDAECVRKP